METQKRKFWEFTTAGLHIVAMLFMLFDHTWSTLLPTMTWMTCIGRIAFPIFAFLLVEGYFHTHDFKKYLLRMLIFALVSEIPFNLMMGGVINPFDQNVMWTFIIALLFMKLLEVIKRKCMKEVNRVSVKYQDMKKKSYVLAALLIAAFGLLMMAVVYIGYVAGMITFVDYHGEGVLMVLMFYILRGRKWYNYILQIAGMYWINVVLLGSLYYTINLLGINFDFYQQAFGMLALIPIWLYQGKQGYHKKWFKYFCYAFYPVHILILVSVGYLIS